MFSRIIRVVVFILAIGSEVEAQWQKISTPFIEANPRKQAITYKAGKLWVATQDILWMTSNDGASWHVRTPEDSIASILAIDFFDENNGLLATKARTYQTFDGGLSWDTLYSQGDNCFAVKFIRSPKEVAIGSNGFVHLIITTDGGLTWDSTDFKKDPTDNVWDSVQWNFKELKDIQTLPSGTVKVLLLQRATGKSQIATTRDFGQTWTFSDGFDYDCFSFGVDQCDSNLMYVVNEEVFEPLDYMAMLYRSFDGGAKWQEVRPTRDLNYYTGSISISPGGVVHLQTRNEGILRSNDNGNYWMHIGGPNGIPDTRLIVAVTDELIYAADNNGEVWMTQNAGGFPAGNSGRTKLELSKKFLFVGAEGSICGDTLYDTVVLSYPECPQVIFNSAAIESNGDYDIIRQDRDTIIVRFIPQAGGKRAGSLVLTLNMATKQYIPLAGSGTIPDFKFSATPPALFVGDSVLLCDIIVRGMRIRSEGCLIPELNGQTVTGDYTLISGLPQVLTGDDSITIAFAPKAHGSRSGTYTIRFVNNTVHTISLAGYGIDPGPNLTHSKTVLFNKDSVALCTTSRDTFFITSNVCIDRFVARQQITGPYANEYTVERTIVNELTGIDTIVIRFAPQDIGLRDAVYEFVANDSSRIVIPLSGRAFDAGYILNASQPALFVNDTVSLCDTIVRQCVITSSGCAVAAVKSESIVESTEYRLLSTLPTVLTGSDTIAIAFAPSMTGLRSAVYELEMTDGKKVRIPLAGIGGGAPYTLSVSPSSLFDTDSLHSCESRVRTITLSKSGCASMTIAAQACSGSAASDYTIVEALADSLIDGANVVIEFRPSGSGLRDAIYEFTLSDGSTVTIPLLGFGMLPLPLSLATEPEFTMDTIGGEVGIPISIAGLDKPRSVELALTFDDLNLAYLGSRSTNGLALDIPGTIQSTSSRLFIPESEVRTSGVSGYAYFQVFADSTIRSRVIMNDLVVTDAPLPCYYTTETLAESSITGPAGCEIDMISDFLRYQKRPDFHIYPNPSSRSVAIATTENVGQTTIEIADQLGRTKKLFSALLQPERPIQFTIIDLPSGVYFVRFKGSGFYTVLPMTIDK